MPDKSSATKYRTSVPESRPLVRRKTAQVFTKIEDGCRDENPGQRTVAAADYAPIFKAGVPGLPWVSHDSRRPRLSSATSVHQTRWVGRRSSTRTE